MDFTLTEDQETIGKVARQLFEHRATPEHLAELEVLELGERRRIFVLGEAAQLPREPAQRKVELLGMHAPRLDQM